MSKIALKVVTIFMCGVAVAVAAVIAISMFTASSIIETIVTEQNSSSLNVLKGELSDELMELKGNLERVKSLGGTLPENEQTANQFWEMTKSNDSEFGAFYDADGKIYWQTENYNVADFDMSMAVSSGWQGIVKDSAADLTIQACVPVENEGKVIGAAVFGRYMNDNEFLDDIKEKIGTELTIFSGDTRFNTTVSNGSGGRATGTQMASNVADIVIKKGENYVGEADVLNQNFYVEYEPVSDIYGNTVGALFSGTSSADTDAMKTRLIVTSIIVALIIAAIAVGFVILASKKFIVDPVIYAYKLADNMSQGLLRAPGTELKLSNDEIGNFIRKLEATKDTIGRYINDINYVLSEMAVGNFGVMSNEEYIGDFVEIKTSMREIKSSLTDIITNIKRSSGDVKSGSEQIAQGSQMLADGTTQQAAAIEQLSASINDISEKVKRSEQNAKDASQISTQTSEKINYQNNEVKNMMEAMNDIKVKSDQIQNIIKSIDDIAFQTNILALNAAVEAARAGAAGKGFAVVADEVRNLAAKSAESAKQTGDLINATITAVNKGTVIAESTAKIMKEVTGLVIDTDAHINDITAAAIEQAKSIGQVNIGIEKIAEVVHLNSATAEETAASCQELSNQSAVLENQIKRFRV